MLIPKQCGVPKTFSFGNETVHILVRLEEISSSNKFPKYWESRLLTRNGLHLLKYNQARFDSYLVEEPVGIDVPRLAFLMKHYCTSWM